MLSMFPYVWTIFPWLFLVIYLLFLYLDVWKVPVIAWLNHISRIWFIWTRKTLASESSDIFPKPLSGLGRLLGPGKESQVWSVFSLGATWWTSPKLKHKWVRANICTAIVLPVCETPRHSLLGEVLEWTHRANLVEEVKWILTTCQVLFLNAWRSGSIVGLPAASTRASILHRPLWGTEHNSKQFSLDQLNPSFMKYKRVNF